MGQLQLPAGKRLAVNLGVDFDAQSLWLGAFNNPSPAMMARGEYGAAVGVPRLLDVFKRYGIKTTFFVIGRKLADPAARTLAERAHAEGHWIGNHTYTHSVPLGRSTEPDVAVNEIARTQARV